MINFLPTKASYYLSIMDRYKIFSRKYFNQLKEITNIMSNGNVAGASSQCYWDELMLLKCERMLLKC